MVGHIYTLCLADTLAATAVGAYIGVYIEMQQGESRERPQHRPDRADSVAYQPSAHRGRRPYSRKSCRSNEKSPYGGNHDLATSKKPDNRTQYLGSDTRIGTIWIQQSRHESQSYGIAYCNNHRHSPSQRCARGRIMVRTPRLPPFPHTRQTGRNILHNPEGTDRRAIDPAEYHRSQNPGHDAARGSRKSQGKNLYTRSPSQPQGQGGRQGGKRQRDNGQHQQAHSHTPRPHPSGRASKTPEQSFQIST